MTAGWRPRPLVREHDGEAMWAGPLPNGPIVRLDDVATLILETLVEETSSRAGGNAAVSSGDVLDSLRDALEGLPADAEGAIEQFFTELEVVGLVERVESPPSAGDTPDSSASADPKPGKRSA